MESVGEYLVSVTGAALVCSGVTCLVDKSKPAITVIRLICGVFLLIVIIRPILQLEVTLPFELLHSSVTSADSVLAAGTNAAAENQQAHINKQLDAYIQQKLNTMNCTLETKFTLDGNYPYAPLQIELNGRISPYLRSYLSNWIHTELGIAPEDQVWNG